MTTNFVGLITSDFKQVHIDMITELIRGCGRECTIIYQGSKSTVCDNCIYDALGKKSSNNYKAGGPIPFTTGLCPRCNGRGRLFTESTDTLTLAVFWNPREWIIEFPVQNPEVYIQTLSVWSTSYMQLKKAREILVDTSIRGYTNTRYTREGEPTPCGLGSSHFCVCMWKRAG